MTESKWTRKICCEMEECNAIVTAMVASMMQQPGIPDRHVCHAHWGGWLEFKGERTRLTDVQKIFVREQNRRRPGTAFVVRAPDRIEDHEGVLVSYFDGTGHDLVLKLGELS